MVIKSLLDIMEILDIKVYDKVHTQICPISPQTVQKLTVHKRIHYTLYNMTI